MHAKLLIAGLLSLATAVTGLPSATSPVAPDVDARALQTHSLDATAGTAGTGDQKRSIEVLAAVSKRTSVPAVDQPLTRKRHDLKSLTALKRDPYYYQGQQHSTLPAITPDMKEKHAVNMAAYKGEPGPKKDCGPGCTASVNSFHSMVSQNSRAKKGVPGPGKVKRSLKDSKLAIPTIEKRMEHQDGLLAVDKKATIERRHMAEDNDNGGSVLAHRGMHTLPTLTNNKMDDTVLLERRRGGRTQGGGSFRRTNSFRVAGKHGQKRTLAQTFMVDGGLHALMTSTEKVLGAFGVKPRHPGHPHTQQRIEAFMGRLGRGLKRSIKDKADSIEKRLPRGNGAVLH